MNKQKKREISEGKFWRISQAAGFNPLVFQREEPDIEKPLVIGFLSGGFLYWQETLFSGIEMIDDEFYYPVECIRYFRKHLSECMK